MDLALETKLADLARARSGLFHRDAAVALGISRKVLDHRLTTGQLVRRHRYVYQAATSPWDLEAREHAALLAAGPLAMLSHDNAARHWSFGTPVPDTVWITLPFAAPPLRLAGVYVVRSRHTIGVRRTRDGYPLTAPPRTWVDLGRTRTREQLEAALANGLQRRLLTLQEIDQVLLVAHNRAGTGLVRAVLPTFQAEWESILSATFARAALADGLALVPSYPIRDSSGDPIAVLDFADPVLRVAIEVDGWHYHGSKLQQQRDKARDRRLLRMGWVTLRFTTEDILQRPGQVLAEVRAVLRARQAA